jgi:hypothetical protein
VDKVFIGFEPVVVLLGFVPFVPVIQICVALIYRRKVHGVCTVKPPLQNSKEKQQQNLIIPLKIKARWIMDLFTRFTDSWIVPMCFETTLIGRASAFGRSLIGRRLRSVQNCAKGTFK